MKQVVKDTAHFFLRILFASLFMRRRPDRIHKVLLSGYTGLGHFVLKSVLIRKIEELYPGCAVHIIAGNNYGTEFVLHKYPTLILKQDSSILKKIIFFFKLRKKKFDVVFLPMDASPKFLIRGSIVAGIPVRVGHVLKNQYIPDYYYTIKVPVDHNKTRSEIDINLDLLQELYQKEFTRNYQPSVDVHRNQGIIEKYGLKEGRYVCLQMSAANGQPAPKIWMADRFRELIQRLLSEYPDLDLVALGDRGDSVAVNRICAGISSGRLKNLSGKTTLEETKDIIFFSKFLICHDSGLLHVGNAMQKELIALYGCSDPDRYMLNLPTCHIIRKDCACSPCLGLFPGLFEPTEAEITLKCPEPECMRIITVDDVYMKCMELLAK